MSRKRSMTAMSLPIRTLFIRRVWLRNRRTGIYLDRLVGIYRTAAKESLVLRLSCRLAPRIVNRRQTKFLAALELGVEQRMIGQELIDTLCWCEAGDECGGRNCQGERSRFHGDG